MQKVIRRLSPAFHQSWLSPVQSLLHPFSLSLLHPFLLSPSLAPFLSPSLAPFLSSSLSLLHPFSLPVSISIFLPRWLCSHRVQRVGSDRKCHLCSANLALPERSGAEEERRPDESCSSGAVGSSTSSSGAVPSPRLITSRDVAQRRAGLHFWKA